MEEAHALVSPPPHPPSNHTVPGSLVDVTGKSGTSSSQTCHIQRIRHGKLCSTVTASSKYSDTYLNCSLLSASASCFLLTPTHTAHTKHKHNNGRRRGSASSTGGTEYLQSRWTENNETPHKRLVSSAVTATAPLFHSAHIKHLAAHPSL